MTAQSQAGRTMPTTPGSLAAAVSLSAADADAESAELSLPNVLTGELNPIDIDIGVVDVGA